MSWGGYYESIDPPPTPRPKAVCPNCGNYLYEGSELYVYYKNGYRHVLGCEECIRDFIEVVGEW